MSLNPQQQDAYVEILNKLLRESRDPLLRARAAQSLGKQDNPKAVATLLEVLLTDPDSQVRLAIIEALDQMITLIPPNPMNDSSSKQPIFHVQQVGTIITGQVTNQGDQIGIQYNTEQNDQLTQALQAIKQVLEDLKSKYPQSAQTPDIIEVELALLHNSLKKKGWLIAGCC
ncbi:MAG: HEAT repeat domain-containing protein [Aphanocapsa sp. GSE-SYN-MK-11-07L]|jgi:hypothetical protein|nr:HEAT repeat domain-containing protein [Aphanocapsa sp. GSE-SYN-MK-11-07L]